MSNELERELRENMTRQPSFWERMASKTRRTEDEPEYSEYMPVPEELSFSRAMATRRKGYPVHVVKGKRIIAGAFGPGASAAKRAMTAARAKGKISRSDAIKLLAMTGLKLSRETLAFLREQGITVEKKRGSKKPGRKPKAAKRATKRTAKKTVKRRTAKERAETRRYDAELNAYLDELDREAAELEHKAKPKKTAKKAPKRPAKHKATRRTKTAKRSR
jgi:DNA-binding protein HU-beta